MTVVGARPQFIKAAVVSHVLEEIEGVEEEIVHTGQHYDANMSQTFFDELAIPEPKVNLGVSGGTHGQMTARMLEALAAAKLHIPMVHVEAGARTHSATNPEEINRICTDHVATRLLACTEDNLENLVRENLGNRSEFSGDPMYDAFLRYSALAKPPELVSIIGGTNVPTPAEFYYVTCHREENTGTDEALLGLLDALRSLDAAVIYSVHPRNRATVCRLVEEGGTFPNILFVEPVGYLESVYLVNHAKQVITDSGGLQREAFYAGVKCTTVLDFEVWPETMVDGRNILAEPSKESILAAMGIPQEIDEGYRPFGDGKAAECIANCVVELAERQ